MRESILITMLVIAGLILIALGGLLVYELFFDNAETMPGEVTNETQEQVAGLFGDDACTELGCPAGTIYVGSINSDKFYTCDCHYALRILPENIKCFATKDEARADGYEWVEC